MVQVRQRVRVAAEVIIDTPQRVPHGHTPESDQVDDIEGANVVRFTLQVLLPVPRAPELEPERFLATEEEVKREEEGGRREERERKEEEYTHDIYNQVRKRYKAERLPCHSRRRPC